MGRKRLPDDYCQYCGSIITRERCGKDSRKYCSKFCYFEAVRAGKQQFKGRCHNEWSAFVDWSHEWDEQRPKPKKQRPRKPNPACKHCGSECNAASANFCCFECVKQWQGVRPCDVCGVDVPNAVAFGRCRCVKCRDVYRRQSNRKHKRKYGRNHRDRSRRANVGYVAFPVQAIYERDGWRCQICNRKCKKAFMVSKTTGKPHPRSPSLDHIKSLRDGGNHEPSNVQLACFECNTLKGAKSRGQLRMAFV
jgi:hypothetical protein